MLSGRSYGAASSSFDVNISSVNPAMPSRLIILLALASLSFSLDITINTTRLISTIKTLATHNDLTPPSVQRVIYTDSDLSARIYVQQLLSSAGLSIQEDPLGNTFAVWDGTTSLPPIATGSHIDAIPHSGMYDGTLGVLGAIEAIRSLQAAGFQPKRDVHIIIFTSEEPTRFGIGCLGSRVLSGVLEPEDASALTDANGITLEEARNAAGFYGTLEVVPLIDNEYDAFVEMHIEQADSLERAGIDIGAVTAIAAPSQMKVKYSGPGGHAGSLVMALRHDPLLAAAELAIEVERVALTGGSESSVATVGEMKVFPGAVNSVPREVEMGIDVRDVDQARVDSMIERIKKAAGKIGREREVKVSVDLVNADSSVTCNETIVQAIEGAARAGGLSVKRIFSRAYHDALFMGKKIPIGMIFVPCRGGVSHRPDEYVSERDLENGVRTLAYTLATLAGSEGRFEVHEEPQNRSEIHKESHNRPEEPRDRSESHEEPQDEL